MATTVTEEVVPTVSELDKVKAAYEKLAMELIPEISAGKNVLGNSAYERSKYQAVKYYFRLIEGKKKMVASETAAKYYWHGKTITYRSRMIRLYAKTYLETGKIVESTQGKHSKRTSVLDDNDSGVFTFNDLVN